MIVGPVLHDLNLLAVELYKYEPCFNALGQKRFVNKDPVVNVLIWLTHVALCI